jgi:hypothetical protein
MTLQTLPAGFPYTVYEENSVFFFISVGGSAQNCQRAEREGPKMGRIISFTKQEERQNHGLQNKRRDRNHDQHNKRRDRNH